MPPLEALVPLVLLPAALVFGFRLVAGLVRGRGPAALPDAVVALGIAAAFMAALWASQVRPRLPLASFESEWTWVFWFAAAGALLGIGEAFLRMPAPARALLRLAAGAGAAWLVVAPVAGRLSVEGLVLRLAASAVATVVVWTAVDRASDARRRAVAVASVVAAGASALVYVFVGRTAVMGQAAGALSAALGAAAAPLPRAFAVRLPRAAAGVVALVVVPLSLAGFTYLNFTSPWSSTVHWPVVTAALVALAPAAGLLVPPRARAAVAIVLAAVLALAVVGGAAVAGGILDAEEPSTSGW